MIKRKLTIPFRRSIGNTTQKPEVLEVVVIPLTASSSSEEDFVLTGGKQAQRVTLSEEINNVVFELVPTDYPELSERIPYRVAWRTQFFGRTVTKDFSMPDFDVNFSDLEDLGSIIGGESYLQQSDLGVSGRVAKLNDDGDVVNAFGVKITGTGDAVAVNNRLDNEIVERQQADNTVRIVLEQQLVVQIQSVLNTTQVNLANKVDQLLASDLMERVARVNAVALLNSQLESLQQELNQSVTQLLNETELHASMLTNKADLVGGKVPTSQLPTVSLTTAVPVASEADMLALTPSQVQPGDLAVRPDGSYMLLQNPPHILSNWIKISTGGEVLSVNGQTGVIVLSASDIGARSASVQVPSEDVAGLDSFKSTTGNTISLYGLRLTALENDALVVRLNNDGVIESSLLGTDVAFVNVGGQLVKKDGTPIVVEGSGAVDSVNGKTGIVVLSASDVGARPTGVDIPASDITDLEGVLEGVVMEGDSRLTDSRTPNSHKTTHAIGGSDQLTPSDIGARSLQDDINIIEVDGLGPQLLNHGSRVNSLESRVGDIEDGLPPNSGASRKTNKFDYWEATDDFGGIAVDSPFGYNPTNPNANAQGFYYDPAGAAEGEGVYAYITPGGHLKLVKRDESNPADPVYAHQDDLSALTSVVGGKANISDLLDLEAFVDLKADQIAFAQLSDTVGTKADQTSLESTNVILSTKANQSDLDQTNTTVSQKANQSDLTVATGRITATENSLTTKANLVGGKLAPSEVPTNIPILNIQGLDTTLSAKADLVGGKLPTSQLPTLATTETYAVANRAAMLALTTSQVQVGDVCIITATADRGTYTLVSQNPSLFTSWLKHTQPDDLVSSVNGQTGVVVLSASDVGARSSVVKIPLNDVDGLQSTLNSKANQSDLISGLAEKTSIANVQSLINTSVACKQLVGRVATTNVSSLAGQQSIDGSLTPLGSTVLLTSQVSSIQNGIYQVNTGAWARVSDMAVGSQFLQGTLVLNSGGAVHQNTFWQLTSTSGIVGVAANNWAKVMTAGPPTVHTAGDGLELAGSQFSVKTVPGGGCVVTANGISVDINTVVRKYAQNIPTGINPSTITHNLGTQDVQVTVREIASGQIVLVPTTVTGPNSVSLDFDSAPSASQYRCVIQA